MLEGYKTYIAAVAFLLLGAYQLTEGQTEQATASFATALGFFGLRRAAANK